MTVEGCVIDRKLRGVPRGAFHAGHSMQGIPCRAFHAGQPLALKSETASAGKFLDFWMEFGRLLATGKEALFCLAVTGRLLATGF